MSGDDSDVKELKFILNTSVCSKAQNLPLDHTNYTFVPFRLKHKHFFKDCWRLNF